MGTRSNIVRENEDGTFDSIYCHWDGYPSNNGRLLYEHYNTPEMVAKLLKLGDLSSLGQRIGEKHDFDKRPEGYDGCTAYGRDRGEKGVKARHYTREKFEAMLADAWTEWVYFFRVADGKWYYTNNPSPTWFKCCGTQQMETALLTPAAWEKEEE